MHPLLASSPISNYTKHENTNNLKANIYQVYVYKPEELANTLNFSVY